MLFVFNIGLLCYNPANSFSMCLQLYKKNNDERKLRIDGYNWIKSDNPSIHYKEHIPLTFLDLCTLDNCLVTEIPLQSEK